MLLPFALSPAYEYAVVVKPPEVLENCNMVSLKDHNINYNMIGDISSDLFFLISQQPWL